MNTGVRKPAGRKPIVKKSATERAATARTAIAAAKKSTAKKDTAKKDTANKAKAKNTATRRKATLSRKIPSSKDTGQFWELRLYVAGQTPLSVEAFANLKRICEEHLKGRYRIEVVDLLVNPTLARGDQILAVPTLVRQLPAPMKKIIGDFSKTERVLVGLNLLPVKAPGLP